MTKSDIQSILGAKTVSFNSLYAKATGSVTAAVFLSQAVFWQEKSKFKNSQETAEFDGETYFSKTAAEWYDETGLSTEQQKTARRALVLSGILKEKLSGVPAKMYFRIDVEVLVSGISAYLNQGVTVSGFSVNKKPENPRTSGGKFRKQEAGKPGSKYIGRELKESLESKKESIAAGPLLPPFTETGLAIGIHDKETPGCVIVDFLPLEENKKKKAPSPGGGPKTKVQEVEGWTKRVASIFDAVASENGVEAFNWQINAGRDFKALKEIRAAMVVDIQRKKNHEPTEPEIESGFEYVFRYGFKYLSGIATGRGGVVQFSPTTIKNCYNQIVMYARQSVNGTLKNGTQPAHGLNKATAQHLNLAKDTFDRWQRAFNGDDKPMDYITGAK